jgi:hypothetical protein
LCAYFVLKEARLADTVTKGAAFLKLFTNSSYPLWLSDFLINSLATQPKMSVWVAKQHYPDLVNGALPGGTANGRYRTYEVS